MWRTPGEQASVLVVIPPVDFVAVVAAAPDERLCSLSTSGGWCREGTRRRLLVSFLSRG